MLRLECRARGSVQDTNFEEGPVWALLGVHLHREEWIYPVPVGLFLPTRSASGVRYFDVAEHPLRIRINQMKYLVFLVRPDFGLPSNRWVEMGIDNKSNQAS